MIEEFRLIKNDETDQAYGLIRDVTEWLHQKNIRQWTDPLPRNEFDRRQLMGQNFGLFTDGRLSVFLSLLQDKLSYWEENTGPDPVWWLCTLATDVKLKHRHLGEKAVREACRFLAGKGIKALYLDCVRGGGFLKQYYSGLGFQTLSEKTIDFPKCGRTEMILMRSDFN